MRCLADTHILLWFLMAPNRIPPRIMAAIEEAEAVYVSGVTTRLAQAPPLRAG